MREKIIIEDAFSYFFFNGGQFSQLDPDPFQIRIRNPAYGFTVMVSSTLGSYR
jgi:hypothetical protein